MEKYCNHCNEEREIRLEIREETYPVRNEPITIQATVTVCSYCGTSLYDMELDDANLEQAYQQYRETHQLLSPDQIRTIREKYHLSQRAMSRLLGWGEITLHRYESGAIPDRVHSDLLRLLADPHTMRSYLTQHSDQISEKERSGLQEILDTLSEESTTLNQLEGYVEHMHYTQNGIFSGYREFDLEKLKQMVIFFSSKISGILKTKLMKVLWYSDFNAYRSFCLSMSGAVYEKGTHGPVLRGRDFILPLFEKLGAIQVIEDDEGVAFRGIAIYPRQDFEASIFSDEELSIMAEVAAFFLDKTSSESSAISHLETAWLETPDWDEIDYRYAHDLKLIF